MTDWFNLHNLWKGKLLTREVCFGVAVLSLCPLRGLGLYQLSLPEFIVPGICGQDADMLCLSVFGLLPVMPGTSVQPWSPFAVLVILDS